VKFVHGLTRSRGVIVHVAERFYNLNRDCNNAGRIVYEITKKQKEMKFNVSVIVPTKNCPLNELEHISVTPNCEKYNIEGVDVFALTNVDPALIGSKCPSPAYEGFSVAFWELVNNKEIFPKIALVHGHDSICGTVFLENTVNEIYLKSVFSLYKSSGNMIPEKLGINFANVSTIWTANDWKNLLNGPHKDFFSDPTIIRSMRILNSTQHDATSIGITDEVMNNLYEAYLKAVYSSGFELSENLLRDNFGFSSVLLNVTERRPEDVESKGQVVADMLMKRTNQESIIPVPRGTEIGKHGFRGSLGGMLQIFDKIGQLDAQNGKSFYGILNGGEGARLSIISLASGGMKGNIRLLDKTMNEISMSQAGIIAQQLPRYGKGWTIVSACDNLLFPHGPIMIGDQFLHKAKQKFLIFAKDIKIRGVHRAEVNHMKNLITILADSKDGSLSELYVRRKDPSDGEYDLEFILSRLNELGGDDIYKGTFYFAMTNDIAKHMIRIYSKPSAKDGRPLYETYGLDFELDFMKALTVSNHDWMRQYSLSNNEHGVPITDLYHIDDWTYLWAAAKRIKRMSNGIGIASLDKSTIWADVGTIKEFSRIILELVRDRDASKPLRKLFGMDELSDIENSYVEGVTFPSADKTVEGLRNSYYIKHSVFNNGGKVGRNCVIVDSVFNEYVEIPDNTIIIGSIIFKGSSVSPADRQDKLIYMYHSNPDVVTEFKGGIAISTMRFGNGKFINGEIPIRISLNEQKIVGNKFAKDKILGHYVLDGKVSQQKIYGTKFSFSELKKSIGVVWAERIHEEHVMAIDKLLDFKREAGK
jgi:NDP-sugar pyrophosphorylase family protein